jgi:hypothetical protein
VTIQFLPAYSPELNPCELVFALVKNGLRRHGIESLFDDVIVAFNDVSRDTMMNFYRKCIYPEQVLPDIPVEM